MFQGILGDVTVQTFNGTQQKVVNWTMTGYPLTKYDAAILDEVSTSIDEEEHSENSDDVLREGPILYAGEFSIRAGQQINDTYVDPSGWGKVSRLIPQRSIERNSKTHFVSPFEQGILYINGFNLGRYWPLVGPQTTLYVPKGLLRHGENSIGLIELQQKKADLLLKFVDAPKLDG